MDHRITVAVCALAVLTLSACSTGDPIGNAPSTHRGNAAACPGTQVDVVVSVSQWADLVSRLGGDCAAVTTVLTSSALDPHTYEPTSGDLAAFSHAQVVVTNGAGYDAWAEKAAATLEPRPDVLTVAAIAGRPAFEPHGRVNPHLWYGPEVVRQVAAAVTSELSARSPAAAGYFAEQAKAWDAGLRPYLDEIAALREHAAGHTYAATETVFDDMAAAVGLADHTPAGYRAAISNESDPSPSDLAAFQTALADHSVDVLVFNTQTEGDVPDQIRAAADKAGVPVVKVTDSPPEANASFVTWQLDQLQELSAALSGRP